MVKKHTITYYSNLLKRLLTALGIKVDQEVYDGHKHIDLSIDSGKLDIEVDGKQHLTSPNQISADIKRAKFSREDGYETIHVHNMDLKDKKDAEDIAKAISQVANDRENDLLIMANEDKSQKKDKEDDDFIVLVA